VSIRPKLIVNTAEAVIDAAIAGVGLTRVLSYQIERAALEKVASRELSWRPANAQESLIRARRANPL